MELVIISPEGTQTHTVAWIEAHTPIGSCVILPEHAPMLLALEPGRELVFCFDNGKQDALIIPQGFIEVTRTRTTVIVNTPLV